jgi:hypothetical protein
MHEMVIDLPELLVDAFQVHLLLPAGQQAGDNGAHQSHSLHAKHNHVMTHQMAPTKANPYTQKKWCHQCCCLLMRSMSTCFFLPANRLATLAPTRATLGMENRMMSASGMSVFPLPQQKPQCAETSRDHSFAPMWNSQGCIDL